MIFLTKLKTAVAVGALLAVIGTAGWMISRAVADETSGKQAAAPVPANPAPAASAVASSAPPTTGPSAVNLSTPADAARSFFIAIRDGDRARAYACLTADPNRPPNLLDAVLAWNMAQNRLVRAATQSFGGDTSAVKQLVTVDTIAEVIVPNSNLTPKAVIDGDTATLTTKIPEVIYAMAPANYQGHLRDWDGRALYFVKQGDQWKFDIDRSMRITTRVLDKSLTPLNSAAVIAIMLEYARNTDQIASAVSDGQITSTDAAAKALSDAGSRVGKDFGISTAGFNIMPAQTAAKTP